MRPGPGTNGFGVSHERHFQRATRAIASRLLQEGVDGLYVFNWYNEILLRRQLLCELADSSALRLRSKTCVLGTRSSSTISSLAAPWPQHCGFDNAITPA